MQVSSFLHLIWGTFCNIKCHMCLRICLYEEFGGGHFFAAEGIPEAKFCAEKKIESVDFFKAVFQWKWKDSNITGTVFQGSENFLILADDRGNHHY